MAGYHVCPADYLRPGDAITEAPYQRDIFDCSNEQQAAERYVEFYHSDLDYPAAIDVLVQSFSSKTVTRWHVEVRPVIQATARAVDSPRRG